MGEWTIAYAAMNGHLWDRAYLSTFIYLPLVANAPVFLVQVRKLPVGFMIEMTMESSHLSICQNRPVGDGRVLVILVKDSMCVCAVVTGAPFCSRPLEVLVVCSPHAHVFVLGVALCPRPLEVRVLPVHGRVSARMSPEPFPPRSIEDA